MSGGFGPCRLCPKGSPPRRLYAGDLCAWHFNHRSDDQSKIRFEKDIDDLVLTPHQRKLLNQYFKEQVQLRPEFCENKCGTALIARDTWRLKAMVCHIVPKKLHPSVMVHPLNRWFGCLDCHHNYDDRGWTYAVTMPVWRVCADRFTKFMRLIPDGELHSLPDAFRVIIEQNPPS